MFESPAALGAALAGEVAQLVAAGPCVLGLATGSSPLPLYGCLAPRLAPRALAHLHCFNLDEYLGLPAGHEQTYRAFMDAHLFSHLPGLPRANTHFPAADGDDYDEQIRRAGGIDLQVLGIGVNGHIGFNEPGDSPLDSRTRVVKLTDSTRQANARFFDGDVSKTPSEAVTMGIATILEARRIVLIATGENKRDIIRQLRLKTDFDPNLPASALVKHKNVTIMVDKAAWGDEEM